jgi:hypothetical protein
MSLFSQRVSDVSKLPSVFDGLRHKLKYHTESGFTIEEANGYAEQLDDIEKVLVPAWQDRLQDSAYEIAVEGRPILGGFLTIRVYRDKQDPVEVFAESYAHFNSEMCDGSCYQYVYQKVLCYEDALSTGRVPL